VIYAVKNGHRDNCLSTKFLYVRLRLRLWWGCYWSASPLSVWW